MTKAKQKLELTWVGKDERPKLEPRILIEEPELSYHADKRYGEDDIFNNILIQGDNLLALKALENDYRGKVKCIYIDPPYNIDVKNALYVDGLENSIWLGLMRDRLELLWGLLKDDGFIAMQIDDAQFARLFLLLAEIVGQKNIKIICVKMSEATGRKMASINRTGGIPKLKEFVILAGKNGIKGLHIQKIPKGSWDKEYRLVCDGITNKQLNEPKSILLNDEHSEAELLIAGQIARDLNFLSLSQVKEKEGIKELNEEWLFKNSYRLVRDAAIVGGAHQIAVSKKISENIKSGCFVIQTKRNMKYLIKGDFNTNQEQPRCKILFADQYLEVHPGDLWTDIKTTGLDNEGSVDFPNGKKPEKLVHRIIQMCTSPGDLVLDSFGGSGTTAAVAHKMGRRWITIEIGDHAQTHIVPRLKHVIDGDDKSGVTKPTG